MFHVKRRSWRDWRKRDLPELVTVTVYMDGQPVVGPLDSYSLAIIQRFGGGQPIDIGRGMEIDFAVGFT